MAGGLGEGQGAQGVADGTHLLAHHQIVGIAQHHRLQAGYAVDLQHRHIVELLAAHQLGIVGVAVVQGHLDGGGPIDDMVIGDDVAVLTDDEPGTRPGALILIPALLSHRRHRDAHAGVGVGGADFAQAHGGQAVGLLYGHRRGIHLIAVDGGLPLGFAGQRAVSRRAAHARAAAHQGAAQHQGNHLARAALFLSGGLGGSGGGLLGLLPGVGGLGGIIEMVHTVVVKSVLVVHGTFSFPMPWFYSILGGRGGGRRPLSRAVENTIAQNYVKSVSQQGNDFEFTLKVC